MLALDDLNGKRVFGFFVWFLEHTDKQYLSKHETLNTLNCNDAKHLSVNTSSCVSDDYLYILAPQIENIRTNIELFIF